MRSLVRNVLCAHSTFSEQEPSSPTAGNGSTGTLEEPLRNCHAVHRITVGATRRSKGAVCAQYLFGTGTPRQPRATAGNRGQRAQQLPLKSRFHARAPNRRRRGREFLGLRGATQGRERPARGEFVHAHGAAGSRVERVVRLSFPDRECTARRGPWPKLCSRSSALFLSARA